MRSSIQEEVTLVLVHTQRQTLLVLRNVPVDATRQITAAKQHHWSVRHSHQTQKLLQRKTEGRQHQRGALALKHIIGQLLEVVVQRLCTSS